MFCLQTAAGAQESPGPVADLGIELNTAKDIEGACRLTFVAVNGTSQALDTVSYEVVVFDGGGFVSQQIIFEFGNLPVGKTKVVRFDIGEVKCADISRLVVNAASACVAKDAALPVCIDAVKTTSRTAIAFGI